MILIICMVILFCLFSVKDAIFEEKLNRINSRPLRLILNGLIYLVCIVLTAVLVIIISRIFKAFNIDLPEITV
ncbi:hypothetical protein CSTERLE_02750 [Thermoclostridium stercorarium subsp. leptospartum DSM 9219]|jgi:hypothetical protein|uniref:Uncharacterized protein n=1 Tax=Thermoclostridium stercorarium subsp. leptospartum DSM 9219 TaxID=1346611 RepID=A0A1B1YII6_THEST|nr:hypothetical protein CSTERLE_02750 [Thermoclostridium stercorarium subsp. leptospartum DSM 9219]